MDPSSPYRGPSPYSTDSAPPSQYPPTNPHPSTFYGHNKTSSQYYYVPHPSINLPPFYGPPQGFYPNFNVQHSSFSSGHSMPSPSTPATPPTPATPSTAGSIGLSDLNFNVEDEEAEGEEAEVAVEGVQLHGGRRPKTNWTVKMDVELVKSYLNCTVDSVRGNDQPGPVYWRNVVDRYNTHVKEGGYQDLKRCKNHWNFVRTLVGNFCTLYDSVNRNRDSGWSDDQVLREALLLYKNANRGKDFGHIHCWELMIKHPKWIAIRSAEQAIKDAKRAGNGEGETSGAPVGDVLRRPQGQKAAKRAARGQGQRPDEGSSSQESRSTAFENLIARKTEALINLDNHWGTFNNMVQVQLDYQVINTNTEGFTEEMMRQHEVRRKAAIERLSRPSA